VKSFNMTLIKDENEKKWIQSCESQLQDLLKDFVSDEKMRERMSYSLLPPGKLFRPLLVYHLASDLGQLGHDHLIFGCSLEMHHCYTLIHDDLPSMDNDDIRRGKPSSHIKFSEWEAILTGDALLGLSFQVLSKIEAPSLSSLLNLYGDKTGAQGLILGQIIDMQAKSRSIEEVLQIHKLKTSALMELALMGCAMISKREDLLETIEGFGLKLGINFQLLDDLCELTEKVQGHEKEANPFLHFSTSEILSLLAENSRIMKNTCENHKLSSLVHFIEKFERKVFDKLTDGQESIKSQIDFNIEDWKFLKA
tara:strand:+ start:9879 stop:10805 length:927 start_codon:yes stop_codon:yes gene_type:complete